MLNNIVLIGMMGSGKTSVGQAISQKANLPFIDTDAMIEGSTKMTISHIFEQYGETYFRSLEAEAAQQAALHIGTVIATGGGIILSPQNMVLLGVSGLVVYLRGNTSQLYERTAGDRSRPLLNAADKRLMKIEELLVQREPLYTQYSDLILDIGEASVDELSEIVLERVKNE